MTVGHDKSTLTVEGEERRNTIVPYMTMKWNKRAAR